MEKIAKLLIVILVALKEFMTGLIYLGIVTIAVLFIFMVFWCGSTSVKFMAVMFLICITLSSIFKAYLKWTELKNMEEK